MRDLQKALGKVLAEIGALEPVTLGTSQKPKVSQAEKEKVEQVIAQQRTFNSRVLTLAISMLVAIFLAAMFLALYHINRPTFAAAAIGGNLLSLLLIVSWMRRLWIERGIIDLAQVAIRGLPPDEGIKLACSMYFGLLAAKTEAKSQLSRKKNNRKIGPV